jgi:hypothetical protein
MSNESLGALCSIPILCENGYKMTLVGNNATIAEPSSCTVDKFFSLTLGGVWS